jgi:hypothetical protein
MTRPSHPPRLDYSNTSPNASPFNVLDSEITKRVRASAAQDIMVAKVFIDFLVNYKFHWRGREQFQKGSAMLALESVLKYGIIFWDGDHKDFKEYLNYRKSV